MLKEHEKSYDFVMRTVTVADDSAEMRSGLMPQMYSFLLAPISDGPGC